MPVEPESQMMSGWKLSQAARESLLGYAVTIFLTVAAVAVTMQLWKADLSVPFLYTNRALDRDYINYQVWIKNTLETGWFLHNPHVGAPFEQDMHDYPMSDQLHFAVTLVLGKLVSRNSTKVYNLFFLLGFPLAAVSTLWVCRRLKLSWGPAIVCSVLFACAPYHFARSARHLMLSSYYMIPPIVLVGLWIVQDQFSLFRKNDTSGRRDWFCGRRDLLLSAAICALVAGAGVYYAFFACMFLMAVGILAAFQQRRWHPLVTAGCCTGLIVLALGLLLSPSFLYAARHGKNPDAVIRSAEDTEFYALRLGQLFQPPAGHPLGHLLPEVKTHEWVVYLGVIGSLGFLALLAWLFSIRWRTDKRLDGLAVMNGLALLVATGGGFGWLFNHLVINWIRCYCRIGIYVAFFSMLAAAIILDQVLQSPRLAAWSRRGTFLLVAALISIGLLDQTNPGFVPTYSQNQRAFASDRTFVRAIEQATPRNAMIFQLPVASFPEAPHIHRFNAYDHFTGFLHSNHLRWSFGGMKGRFGDRWQYALERQELPAMLRDLVLAGFSGIQLDRHAYPDGGVTLEARLRELLQVDPVVSPNLRKTFFSLAKSTAQLRQQYDDAEWARLRELVLNPVSVQWGRGFSVHEATPSEYFRWCGHDGEMHLENAAAEPREVTLRWTFLPGNAAPSDLRITGALLPAETHVGRQGCEDCLWRVTVPPGKHTLRFHSDASPFLAYGDPRTLVFRVKNLAISSTENGILRTARSSQNVPAQR